jgi:hypothetical protein
MAFRIPVSGSWRQRIHVFMRGGRGLCLGVVCLAVLLSGPALAKEGEKKASNPVDPTAKELSGMSIVGNDEAPKSLYILPWKSSEIGVETSLNAMLNEREMPVDRDVFKRQLDFYKVSTAK